MFALVRVNGILMFLYREDLLDPSHEVKCAPVIVNDESTVDPSAVYYPSELARGDPTRMKVRDLKQELESDDAESKHCLDESQRNAVRSALSQPLTVIQVHMHGHCITFCIFCPYILITGDITYLGPTWNWKDVRWIETAGALPDTGHFTQRQTSSGHGIQESCPRPFH